MEKKRKSRLKISTMELLAMGFLGIIFLGGVLLWLPACNKEPITFTDALFTSTTAVCVTGLVTVVPAAQFTILGQVILLILIQVGGLGVMACMCAFFLIIRKHITVRERIMIQETYSMDSLSGMVRFIRRVLKGTFIVEGIGAVFYALQFVPEYGLVRGIWYSVFHAVSAFCNAGVDILGDSSLIRYVSNPIVNFTTMALIVFSGLGFIVWSELWQAIKRKWKEKCSLKLSISRLSVHTKLVLIMTTVLIVGGTVNFFLMEHSNPGTMGKLTFGEKWMAAAFHSISTRTAGFSTIPQALLREESMVITCILMFIGGSPGGTAGGIKTTTVALLILACITMVRGGKDIECFGRKIPTANFRTGFTVFMIAFLAHLAGTVAITAIEGGGHSFINILYETTSAIGTVGLTADLTPKLHIASKYIIMVMMYMGRLGPMTLALVFGNRAHPRDKIRELPESKIFLG